MTDTDRPEPDPDPDQAGNREPPPHENNAPKSRPKSIPDGEAIAELGDKVGGPA
jgi:hypothetical protein